MIRSRTLLLWLLMLVLPLQGMAASTMALCGPADAVSPSLQSFEAHHHGPATAQTPAHHHHDPAAAGAMGAGATDGPTASASAAAAGHLLQHCCGAACTMAFAVTGVLLHPDQEQPPLPQRALARLDPGVVLDGLDRPPQA